MGSFLAEGFEASAIGRGSFRVDAFQVPVALGRFPHAELLYVPPNGMDAEIFFCGIRQTPDLAVKIDLELFPHAARIAQYFEEGCSLNVQAETLFDCRFHALLDCLVGQAGFDPDKVWIEKTEQGQIPENADLTCLAKIRALGFRLGLDDLDISDEANMSRISLIGDQADMFKFSYKTMSVIRDETDGAALQRIADIARAHPTKVIVMEGVRFTDHSRYGELLKAGVHMFQIYDPEPKGPSCDLEGPFPLRA